MDTQTTIILKTGIINHSELNALPTDPRGGAMVCKQLMDRSFVCQM
jgi:hypothetical protein